MIIRHILSFLAAVITAALPLAACATPLSHQSYTYNEYGDSVPSPDPYEILAFVDGTALGCGSLKNPGDLCFGTDGKLYIADTGNNRIVILKTDFTLDGILVGAWTAEGLSAFNQPRGVYAAADGTLYVADTMNARVLRLDDKGNLLQSYGVPESDLIDEDFNYRPLRLCVDESRRIYVVAASVNDGILLIDSSGSFEGFLAAARVNPDPIRVLWKRLATKEQRSRMEDFVPVEYNSVDLDSEGFIYATTAAVDEDVVIAQVESGTATEEGAIVRRLNMLGQDILRREGYFPQVGDVEDLQETDASFRGVSQIMDVAAGDNGCYFLLDNNRKRIFAYDQDGYLLYAFSGPGQSQGGFLTPTALAVRDQLLVALDKASGVVTVFSRTAYGDAIHEAIAAYDSGNYELSKAAWETVLASNTNLDSAYAGMGKAAYRSGDYKQAMEYFSSANLTDWYGKAFEQYRKAMLKAWFGSAVLALLGVILATIIVQKLLRRKVKTS